MDPVERPIDTWGDLLLDEHGMDEAVDHALAVTRQAMDGDPEVSLTIRSPHDAAQPHTRGATAELARRLDEWQYVNGEGPCVAADRDLAVCAIDDLATDTHFPEFRDVALDLGVRGVVSFPLLVRGTGIGSLNAFFAAPGQVGEEQVDIGGRLAATFSPLLANFLTHQRSVELTNQLEEALEGRAVIERAKGLLMARLGVSAEHAFELLSTQSQHENRKLRAVAAELVEQHERDVAGTA